MTFEADFHLNGFVNKQNFRYWEVENPKIVKKKGITSTTRDCVVRNYVRSHYWRIYFFKTQALQRQPMQKDVDTCSMSTQS